jgi:transketolase
VLADPPGGTAPEVILIGTGSEVHIALAAGAALWQENVAARVVSMPCLEWFAEQDQAYRDEVLPPRIRARVSVEAGIGLGWRGIVGDAGEMISLEHFGASAAYEKIYAEFGITPERVAEAARLSLTRGSGGSTQ